MPVTIMLKAAPVRIAIAAATPSDGVDLQAFLLGHNSRVHDNSGMVFKGNPGREGDAVRRRGMGMIDLNLANVPARVTSILFAATSRPAPSGTVEASITVQTHEDRRSVRIPLPAGGVVTVGSLRRWGDQWRFDAHAGRDFKALLDLAISLGVDIRPKEDENVPLEQRVARVKRSRTDAMISRDPDLALAASAALTVLERHGCASLSARVALMLDISVSMLPHFESGAIDDLVRRVLGMGFEIDDDGSIDAFLFGAEAYDHGAITERNYHAFTEEARRLYPFETNTMYGQAMQTILSHYADEPEGDPVMVLFVTDGDTNDKEFTEKMLRIASSRPIFWQFIAIGKKPRTIKEGKWLPEGFSFLERINEVRGRVVDNVAFASVENPSALDQVWLYESMIEGFLAWRETAIRHKVVQIAS